MNVLQALGDSQLLGALPCFRDLSTWRAWLAFLRAVHGLPMGEGDLALFRKHTGRTTPRPGGYAEAVAITGRQSGKSQLAAAVAAFEAAVAGDRGAWALLISQDARAAGRVLFGYARECFEASPILKGEVVRETTDTLELAAGTSLACYPCRPAAIRGLRASVAVVDELAYFITSEGRPVDREMLRAVRPTLATTDGKLLVLSSPYGQSGALWDLHRQHYGREDSRTLVWQASAPEMNPTLPADYLARMEQDDPEAYRSEVLGEFRAGLSTLFDLDVLDACVVSGVHEVAPVAGVGYEAHFDASGGRSDAAALAVGHAERAGLARVDLVRRWPAPHNPEAVIGEAADELRRYGLWRVQVDRYAGDFPAQAFRRHGIAAEVAPRTTSENHLAMLPLVNAGAVALPDAPELLRELRGLERRTGLGGRDRVDHRPGAHDDLAAAVSGVLSLLADGPHDLGITFPDGLSM